MTEPALFEALLDALPQTQCTRCGYADCAGYARAMASGEAGIDRCPPGGAEGVRRLARLTGRPAVPLDRACGSEGPRALALIDEAACIGCALCLKACPVDAIVGAGKRMHTVVEALCTGCELCIPVCPVDCISLVDASGERTGWAAWSTASADQARERFRRHLDRTGTLELPLDRPIEPDTIAVADPARGAAQAALTPADAPSATTRRATIAAALARARSARAAR